MSEDLGVKIGSPGEVLWTRIKQSCEVSIKSCEEELIIQREILKLAESKIEEEKEKFK